jgi:hypothetical protein
MRKKNLQKYFRLAKITAISTCLVSGISAAKTDVPLFLLSGQSNMAGMQAPYSSALTEEQKKKVDNVKIYQATEGAYLNKWSTLGPGFGSDKNNIGPELFFGRTLSDSMPDIKIALIKDSRSGTPLGQSSGWLPPSSGGPGTLYKNMMTHIDAALKAFNDAFDTSKYAPRWAGFVWLQGENDAMNQSQANKYEENLSNLIKDIRKKAEADSMPAIIPMIDIQSSWTHNSIVRAAEIAVTTKLVNVDTMDTHGLPTNKIHYTAKGHITIGTVCAQRWLAMNYTKDWWTVVPVAYQPNRMTHTRQVSGSSSNWSLFDLSGRKVAGRSTVPFANQLQRHSPTLVILEGKNSESGTLQHFKTVNLQK